MIPQNSALSKTLSYLWKPYIGFLLLCCVALRPALLSPDGVGYYSFLPSLFLDRDLNFLNEFAGTGLINPQFSLMMPLTPTGYVFNHYPIGTVLLWSPFWLLGHVLTLTFKAFGIAARANGFSFYYTFGVHFATALMGFCTLLISINQAKEFSSEEPSHLAALGIAAGTPFFWYCFINADMSHIAAAFANSLFLFLWFKRLKGGGGTRYNLALLGLLGSLSTVVRLQDGVIFVFLLVLWFREWRSKKLTGRTLWREVFYVMAGAFPVFLLQAFIWLILFGQPLGPSINSGYSNPYQLFSGLHLYGTLLSSYHGLFFVSPILFLSLAGLIRLSKEQPTFGLAAWFVLISQMLLLSTDRMFWEGLSFGLRRMVDWTPLFVLGLAVFFRDFKRLWHRLIAVFCILWTVILAWTYANQPLGILNEYQTGSQILGWIAELMRKLPESLTREFQPIESLSTLLPAVIIFGVAGFVVLIAMLQLLEGASIRGWLFYFSAILIVFYVLVGLSALNGESSKKRYARELAWLGAHQNEFLGNVMSGMMLQEGIFRNRNGDLDGACASFQEAIRVSPFPASMKTTIRNSLSKTEWEEIRHRCLPTD
jgi:hypothetical protein